MEDLYHTHQAEYFADTQSCQFLLGRAAMNAHLESGGHPADVISLDSYLTNRSLPKIETPRVDKAINWSSESKEGYILSVQWLASLVPRVTEDTIQRANSLNLIGSRDQVRTRFITLANLYSQAGLGNTIRKGTFKSTSEADLLEAVRGLQRKKGRTPTWNDFEKEARVNPYSPRPFIIKSRFGSLTEAAELANLSLNRPWQNRDRENFVEWGLMCADANNGLVATERVHRWFSNSKKYGFLAAPPVATTVRKFKKFSNYQEEVKNAYQEKKHQEKKDLEEKLELIKKDLQNGRLPQKLFEGIESSKQMITRHAWFLIIADVAKNIPLESRVEICVKYNSPGRILDRIKQFPEYAYVTDGEIEHSADWRGYFDDLWPLNSYVRTLRLPSDFFSLQAQRKISYVTFDEE